jgi:hypothetical protein
MQSLLILTGTPEEIGGIIHGVLALIMPARITGNRPTVVILERDI